MTATKEPWADPEATSDRAKAVDAGEGPLDDKLISVDELARLWRTSSSVVASYMSDGSIPSLDGGGLARSDRLDVPVTRASWAEAVRQDSPGAVRRLDANDLHIHPAAAVALDLHWALAERDAKAVAALCSTASVETANSESDLVDRWINSLGEVFNNSTGIATGVYALTPHRGVGVRLVKSIGPIPEVYNHPTPVDAIGVIVLIQEDDRWVADISLTEKDVNYAQVVASAPPDEWEKDHGPLQ